MNGSPVVIETGAGPGLNQSSALPKSADVSFYYLQRRRTVLPFAGHTGESRLCLRDGRLPVSGLTILRLRTFGFLGLRCVCNRLGRVLAIGEAPA